MKKILSTLACVATLASVASADFLRVEAGAGMWAQSPSGEISYTNAGATAKNTSNKDAQEQGYIWALIKHPIPIVPNLRLEYAGIASEGIASGSFKNFKANGGKTSLDMTQYDIIPYYNILDNTFWISVDVGLDIKIMETDYSADSVDLTGTGVFSETYSDSTTIALPMLYLRGRTQIPMTEIGLEADVKYISYDDNTMYDFRIKVDYTLDFIPIIQPAIELGYRIQKIETEDGEDANINMDFAGVYAGLMVRF